MGWLVCFNSGTQAPAAHFILSSSTKTVPLKGTRTLGCKGKGHTLYSAAALLI